MLTGPTHYLVAEQLLERAAVADTENDHPDRRLLTMEAQAHATLALAAATACAGSSSMQHADRQQWLGAVSAVMSPSGELDSRPGLGGGDPRAARLMLAGPAGVRPTITVLCGSTRFGEAYRDANLRLTLAGHIVLSVGCHMRSDGEMLRDEAVVARLKARLDVLHLRKVDLADEVLVLNVGGYIGESTRSEIAYAEGLGKPVRYLEPFV